MGGGLICQQGEGCRDVGSQNLHMAVSLDLRLQGVLFSDQVSEGVQTGKSCGWSALHNYMISAASGRQLVEKAGAQGAGKTVPKNNRNGLGLLY